MAKKAELGTAYHHHEQRCQEASALEAVGDFRRSLERAEAAIPFLGNALAYQRRFLKPDVLSARSVDHILRLAPLIFMTGSLRTLEEFCAGRSRAERAALPELPERIAAARSVLALAVGLWSRLHAEPARHFSESSHPGEHESHVLAWWQRMGLVSRPPVPAAPARPVTDLRRVVRGKCSNCGVKGRAALEQFLKPRTCPGCRQPSWFVILHTDP